MRNERRKRRAQKKSKTDSDVTYFPGAFGLNKHSDIDFNVKEKSQKISRKITSDVLKQSEPSQKPKLTFVDETKILQFICIS